MKKLLTLTVLGAALCANAAGVKNAEFADGYYRIGNNFTNRYIQVVDNRGSLNYTAASADMAAIRLRLGLENVISDPASVLYMEKHGDKYDIKAQNTGIHDIIGSYVNIMHNPQDESTYWAYGSKSGFTLYLYDYYGNGATPESWLDTTNKTYPLARNWDITPIDNSTENYFGITPSVAAQGKYYQPFYASFPFSCASDGMKVYYITIVDEKKGELVYKEIKGTVPALTPVIIECSSAEPQNNKLNIGGKASAITGNQLVGVLYDFRLKGHENYVAYDESKMRLLGSTTGGVIGGVVAKFDKDVKYKDVTRNTVYIPVSSTAPAEFKLVHESNYSVDVPAESLTLDKKDVELKVGETLSLSATVLPENTTDRTLTWASSNESVATVDATGKITAVSAGSATITAKCGSAVSTCAVKVVVPVVSAETITLDKKDAELKVDETLSLSATVLPENTTDKTVTWASSDESVATVDAIGKITAVSAGTATITAKCGAVSASCVVTVTPAAGIEIPAESVTLSRNDAEMNVGETISLIAYVLPENAADKTVTWTSSDETVAMVNVNGAVTAVSVGSATITAKCGEVSATCVVTVVGAQVVSPESITLSFDNAEMNVGETLSPIVNILPENTTDKTVTWTSSDEAVATVDATGKITAVSPGSATITAKCGAVYATCTVVVVEDEPQGESKEFVGTIDIDLYGETTSMENQKLDIINIQDDHCTLALYHFSLVDGVDLGDIIIENVDMSETDGDITYKGSKKDLSLAGGRIVADVECEGTENADGIITIIINVLWSNGPFQVTFTNDVSGIFDITAEDAPAEYYHINGVKAAGLTPGLYIKIQGGKATKVLVK